MTNDESKLTAYALGEVDEAERAAMEARLETDAAARKQVEEIRALAGVLTGELKKERVAVSEPRALASGKVVPLPHGRGSDAVAPRRRLFTVAGLAALAALVMVAVLVAIVAPEPRVAQAPQSVTITERMLSGNIRLRQEVGGTLPVQKADEPSKPESKSAPAAGPASTLSVGGRILFNRERDNSLQIATELGTVKNSLEGTAGNKGLKTLPEPLVPHTEKLSLGAPAPAPQDKYWKDQSLRQGDLRADGQHGVLGGTGVVTGAGTVELRDGAKPEKPAFRINHSNEGKPDEDRLTVGGLIKVPSSLAAESKSSAPTANLINMWAKSSWHQDGKPADPAARRAESDRLLKEAQQNIAGDHYEVALLSIVGAKAHAPENERRLSRLKVTSDQKQRLLAEGKKLAETRKTDGEFLAYFGGVIDDINNWPVEDQPNTEAYDRVTDNPFQQIQGPLNALSTFSIDVDTASYSNVRRYLTQGQRPPKDAVRIEELVNYFKYDYARPNAEGDPFAVNAECAVCPWDTSHRLVRFGIKGREIDADKRPPSNLVFLIDVSGSMFTPNKLPLVQQSLKLLVDKLGENDRVAMVVYAGASGLVLPSTSCLDKATILAAIDRLKAGGSTNGGSGIELAYKTATEHFIQGGTNRVILSTDGDWNVGITDQGSLTRLIEEKAKSGVFLSVLGFGMGNYKDGMLEKLADKGNGNYGYVDNMGEAKKIFVEQLSGTLVCIAKDVKLQIEFNPAQVHAWRLIGYENRVLAHEDFNDDKKDAGDIGAGHTVTALYEIVPVSQGERAPAPPPVDPLKYQVPSSTTPAADNNELLTLKIRYKQPDGQTSKKLEFAVADSGNKYSQASKDYKFAAAVASFGMLLRESPYKGNATFDSVLELATECVGADALRAEFIEMVKKAKQLPVVRGQ